VCASKSPGNSDELAHDWAVWLLSKPFGQWSVCAAGLIVVIAGIGIGIKGVRAGLERWQGLKPAEPNALAWLRGMGTLARGFDLADWAGSHVTGSQVIVPVVDSPGRCWEVPNGNRDVLCSGKAANRVEANGQAMLACISIIDGDVKKDHHDMVGKDARAGSVSGPTNEPGVPSRSHRQGLPPGGPYLARARDCARQLSPRR
jgi:hypothetical protein